MTVKQWVVVEQAKHPICKCGCGGEIIIKPWHHSEGIPEFIKGHENRGKNNPLYQKHHTIKTKVKISKARIEKGLSKGKNNGMFGVYRYGKDNPNFGNHKLAGKNHPNWKGGITLLTKQIRDSEKYKEWRLAVFTRDNFTCQGCGDNVGGNLNADHIKEFVVILNENNIATFEQAMECAELWDINNGRTLCKDCHIERHKRQAYEQGKKEGIVVGYIKRCIEEKQLGFFDKYQVRGK